MRLAVNILKLFINQLSVHVHRGYIPMAHQFLNRVDIRAVFQQVRSEGMPKSVRRNVLLNSRLFLIVLHDLPEALSGHVLSADVDEQRLLRAFHK